MSEYFTPVKGVLLAMESAEYWLLKALFIFFFLSFIADQFIQLTE